MKAVQSSKQNTMAAEGLQSAAPAYCGVMWLSVGIKSLNWLVLRQRRQPSILIEVAATSSDMTWTGHEVNHWRISFVRFKFVYLQMFICYAVTF